MSYELKDYSFEGLCLGHEEPDETTLAYLVGLVDSEAHIVRKPSVARYDILYPLSEVEGQVESPEALLSMQSHNLPGNYLPQTPVMYTLRWSPIHSMLSKGFEPIVLTRDTRTAPTAIASGIWKPRCMESSIPIRDCDTDEELFWAIMSIVFGRALERSWFVSIIAQPGWRYEDQIDSLQHWDENEISRTGRILWKCTPHG